jgi:hypothetical protein
MDITAIATHESKLKHLLLQTIRELRPDGWEAITKKIVLSEIRSFSFSLTISARPDSLVRWRGTGIIGVPE